MIATTRAGSWARNIPRLWRSGLGLAALIVAAINFLGCSREKPTPAIQPVTPKPIAALFEAGSADSPEGVTNPTVLIFDNGQVVLRRETYEHFPIYSYWSYGLASEELSELNAKIASVLTDPGLKGEYELSAAVDTPQTVFVFLSAESRLQITAFGLFIEPGGPALTDASAGLPPSLFLYHSFLGQLLKTSRAATPWKPAAMRLQFSPAPKARTSVAWPAKWPEPESISDKGRSHGKEAVVPVSSIADFWATLSNDSPSEAVILRDGKWRVEWAFPYFPVEIPPDNVRVTLNAGPLLWTHPGFFKSDIRSKFEPRPDVRKTRPIIEVPLQPPAKAPALPGPKNPP